MGEMDDDHRSGSKWVLCMSTRLTFINDAFDLGEAAIVLFQCNALDRSPDTQVVWRSIRYCGLGWNHPFEFSDTVSVSISDAFGNFSERTQASKGDCFEVVAHPVGRGISRKRKDSNNETISVANSLPKGAVDVNLSRGERVVAQQRSIAPGQSGDFDMEPELWIGLSTEKLRDGFVPRLTKISFATKLSLHNIASADIVMRGAANSNEPVSFQLTNIHSGGSHA